VSLLSLRWHLPEQRRHQFLGTGPYGIAGLLEPSARGMHDSMARDLPSPIAQPRVGPTERTVSAKSADTVRSCKHDSRGNNSYEHITYGPAGDEKAMWMARDENGISDIGTSVATIRDISAQDALRPSPVSASSLPKRAATIATVTSKDRHMVSSKLPSLSSVLESLPTQNMMPEMTCFPALAQLEDGASRNAPSFPHYLLWSPSSLCVRIYTRAAHSRPRKRARQIMGLTLVLAQALPQEPGLFSRMHRKQMSHRENSFAE
jgi:hypothetical protein